MIYKFIGVSKLFPIMETISIELLRALARGSECPIAVRLRF